MEKDFQVMKVALVLPYFGKFDKLFPLWLASCKWNPHIDWMIFTDDKSEYEYPANVKVHYMSFKKLKSKIQSLYDFPISLETPYRLCNFKPAYGEIFKEYLEDYDVWGFCDNDMVYGQILDNVPTDIPQLFKIGKFGHLSFVAKNAQQHLYRYNNAYKIAFATPRPLFFDEGCFMKILSKFGYSEIPLHIADLKPRVWKHIVLSDSDDGNRDIKYHCFVWDKGILMRYYLNERGSIEKEEYVYIHFLKRPMAVDEKLDVNRPVVIVPNRIFNMDLSQITPEFLKKVCKNKIFWDYWKNSFRPKNFWERLKNRLYQTRKDVSLINKMNKIVDEKSCLD